MSRSIVRWGAVGLVAGWLVGCAPTGKLSAADIVARNLAARGGLDAWRKVQTMVWNGHIESAHAPAPSMLFELDQKRPNKTRLLISAMGERSVRVFDGSRGWKMRLSHGKPEAEPYSLPELRSAQAGHGIDGPLIDHAARGESVTLEGVERVGERKAYHLGVHLAKGGSEDVWVDAETYLDIRFDRMVDGPAGAPRRVSVTYGDYRKVEGLQIPFLVETGEGSGVSPDRMVIERVLLNAALDDSAFENPASTHHRARTRPSIAFQGPARSALMPGAVGSPVEDGGTSPQ
ncbi:MAG TPA: hypothetical protein VMU15_19065 [Anaeromyxobacter sp.]|nr:hypothetical protein [Anaeromyxobacter sp.]